jgi:RimJ/RimL family protein N-acetyltransferase
VPDLVYGMDRQIAQWVALQLDIRNYDPCVAMGVALNGKIVAGALYNNFHYDSKNRPMTIEISFATIDKRWASRAIIGGLLSYPFDQLKLVRVQSTVSKRNKSVRLFLERLGFKLEGVGRAAWPHGGDACMYSMLRNEFNASKWNIRGKINAISSCSTRSNNDSSGANSQQSTDRTLQFRP